MTTSAQDPPKQRNNFSWAKLYPALHSRVTQWVRSSYVPSWVGQEEDIIEDIVGEAVARTFRYSQRAEGGEARSIGSLEHISAVISYHYYVDLWRRDRRLVRFSQKDRSDEGDIVADEHTDLPELATNNMFLESLYARLAYVIVGFPDKQRTALLIDLANRMHFGIRPTPLQQAFLNVGIQMQDYQIPLPVDPVQLSRHRSLLSLAYKRLKELTRVKEYCSAA